MLFVLVGTHVNSSASFSSPSPTPATSMNTSGII